MNKMKTKVRLTENQKKIVAKMSTGWSLCVDIGHKGKLYSWLQKIGQNCLNTKKVDVRTFISLRRCKLIIKQHDNFPFAVYKINQYYLGVNKNG